MASHTQREHSSFRGQSAINQDAADGGYWHEEALAGALSRWRRDPLGARLALSIFGQDVLRASSGGASSMADPAAKPDLRAWMRWPDGSEREAHISAKLARIGSTDSPDRPMHHAARIKFEDADQHGLLPVEAFDVRGAILSHFIDGESLSRQDPAIADKALAHFKAHWSVVARSAIQGMSAPFASHLVISLAKIQEDGALTLQSSRSMSAEDAIAALCAAPPSLSAPRDGQVGTIGSKMMHIQRGQALSLGSQRDIQIKINVGALYLAAGELPDF